MGAKKFCSSATPILFLAVFSISGCAPHIKNLDSRGSSIICFGDSITYGVGASEGENYPAYLSILLKKDVINAGASGDGTADALGRLERDVLTKDPYIVIVEFGGNDFLRGIPKGDTLKNLKEMISRIQDEGAMVVLCDVSSGFLLSGYRRDYGRLARETGSIFVPALLEEILTDGSLRYDEIHPNMKGYEIIAKKLHEVIKRYMR